jgi:Tfp pilus assembly protein PilO
MTFTKRERLIMIFSIAAIVLLIGDRYFLSPIMSKYSRTQEIKQQLQNRLDQSNAAIQRKAILQRQWQKMNDSGLKYNFAAAESNILRYIKDSALKNSLVLSSVQPQLIESKNDIREMEFIVSGTGSMDAVTNFLWDMETSELPLKTETFQLGSNDENAYQMSVQVKLSSIYIATKEKEKDVN